MKVSMSVVTKCVVFSILLSFMGACGGGGGGSTSSGSSVATSNVLGAGSSGSLAGVPSGQINLPRDANGWSIFTPSADSRIVYISESGDDATGQVYSSISFTDPFEPTGEQAFATYLGAFAHCRDGYPDWILFKRGDVFIDHIPDHYAPNGRSETEPFLVGAYGTTHNFPILKIGSNIGLDFRRGASFVVYNDLDVYAHTANPDDPDFVDYSAHSQAYNGTLSTGSTINGLLMEGCKFRFSSGGLIQNNKGDACGNITIRRSLFYKNYARVGSHTSGVAIFIADGVIFKENILYHNGWLIQNKTGDQGATEEGQATYFNHNMYLSKLKNTVIENNLILEGAAAGVKITSDATAATDNVRIENNLFLGGTIGTNIGNNYDDVPNRFKNIVITNNVFTDIGWSRPTNRAVAWYTYNDGWDIGEFTNNLLIHQNNALNTNCKGIYFSNGDINDVDISNNTIYGLDNGVGLDFGNAYLDASNVTVDNNIVQMPSTYKYIARLYFDNTGMISFTDNRLYSADGSDSFYFISSPVDYTTWQSSTGDNSVIEQVSFVDNTRSIETYNASVGGTATIQAFIDACVAKDRYNWNTDYDADTVNTWLRAGFTVP